MERRQVLDLMGNLKPYGMRSACDEIMANGIKRQPRHRSVSANPDDGLLDEDNSAAEAASSITKAISGNIVSLFVTADPRTLGETRRHFHDAIMLRLVGELAKDLTGHTVAKIEAALARA